MTDDDAWFAPKIYGYGSGLPLRWQGWALVLAHAGGLAAGIMLLRDNSPGLVTMAALLLGLAPLPLYAAHTRGGWRWRWGTAD